MTEPRSDDDIDRALTQGLRTEPLSEAAMARLRAVALQEWRQTVGSRPLRAQWRRSSLWLAAAAALVCIVLGATWLRQHRSPTEVFGVVVRADPGEGEIASGWTLHAGDLLTTHGPVLIALSAGGTLRVAPDTVLKLTSASEAALSRGRIYLDFPAGPVSRPFDISTRVGTLEHVGTEYEVLSNDEIVRVRVREGRVRLRHDSTQTLLDAGTQLLADAAGHMTRGSIEPYGRDWLWVAALAPDYEIEGRPLLDFLQWAARELGRSVKFSDSHAREVAQRTILHGSVKGRDPMDALSTVLSTTTLTYEIRGDTIWIQSGQGT